MFCPKCGKENDNGSTFCAGCGFQLNNKRTSGGKVAEKELFGAHLLNIFSVVVPAVLLGGLSLMSESPQTGGGDGGINVTMNADTSSQHLFYAMILGLIVFVIGIIIYLAKSKKIKLTLSYVYLLGAIGALVFLFFTAATYIIATCGLGVVMFIPGILQVLAGVKFLMGSKVYGE